MTVWSKITICILGLFLLGLFSGRLAQAASMHHFAYLARDRELLQHPGFLDNPHFEGAQIMYLWRRLEPAEGEYDFSDIREDLALLKAHHKTLFIQLQDANFMPGEWLPWENQGYLESVYDFAQKQGMAVGTPDLMPELYTYASQYLRVQYMFWVIQEPYFTRDLLPFLSQESDRNQTFKRQAKP